VATVTDLDSATASISAVTLASAFYLYFFSYAAAMAVMETAVDADANLISCKF